MAGQDIRIPETLHFTTEEGADKKPTGADEPIEGLNPRKSALDEIYANRRKAIEKEIGHTLDTTPADDAAGGAAPEGGAAPAGDQPTSMQDAPAAAADAGAASSAAAPAQGATNALPDKVRIKVEGREIEVTSEMLVDLAQKGLNSDQRYQEAAQIKREAINIANNARNAQPAQQPAAQPQAPQQPARMEVFDENEAQRLARDMLYGSEADQAKAIRDLGNTVAQRVSGLANNGYTPEQIVHFATQNAKAEIRNEMRQEQQQQKLVEEFQDIFSDYPLSTTAGAVSAQLQLQYQQKGVQKPMMDIYREACTYVRNNYTKKSGEAPAPASQATAPAISIQAAPVAQASNSMSERLERKRVAPQPPAAASKVISEQPASQSVSGSSVVQWMRKSRGQPNY